MKTLFTFIFTIVLCTYLVSAQTTLPNTNYTIAPNSYIFNTDDENCNNCNGLYIPVKKAYIMWAKIFVKDENTTPIPYSETSTAQVYWEDVPGLVRSVSIEGSGSSAKIKVEIDKAKGEGNALISYHVGEKGNQEDPVYWSWHIWVTDNPTNGVSYGHSEWPERDGNGNVFTPKYMDRNLGATNAHFLGNDWNKSAGLMYQWGRKDPIPPLKYKDESRYLLSTVNGYYKSQDYYVKNIESLPRSERNPDNYTVLENLKYATQNPLFMITKGESTWWGSKGNNFPQDDLWSSNYKVNPNTTNSSAPYPDKSVYDPCPNGWRVPSFRSKSTLENVTSPWGKQSGILNRDAGDTVIESDENLDRNSGLKNIKIYPALGIDFSNVEDRNLGLIPLTGKIYPTIYTDNYSEAHLLGATLSGIEARELKIISDPHQTISGDIKYGKHLVDPFQSGSTLGTGAVRCMTDPNYQIHNYNFETEYFSTNTLDYTEGLHNPNSYIVTADNQEVKIPLNKAYAMYNQYLTNHEWPTQGERAISIVWTDNENLIQSIQKNGLGSKNDSITVKMSPEEYGNAVIALHLKDADSEILWSWHIWAPKENPNLPENQIEYTTEPTLPSVNLINPTTSGFPALTTTFMNMNLGALNAFPIITEYPQKESEEYELMKNSGGLHYQWGRKDPIPPFGKPRFNEDDNVTIYTESEINQDNSVVYLSTIENDKAYRESEYTKEYSIYLQASGVEENEDIYTAAQKVLRYSVSHPLTFLYQEVENECIGDCDQNFREQALDWISDQQGIMPERWGHAEKKSPFDPCPEGWRVPDTSFANLTGYSNTNYPGEGAKGNSPWYFSKYTHSVYGENFGLKQFYGSDVAWSIKSQNLPDENLVYSNGKYPGIVIDNPSNGNLLDGWVFSFPDFNIGNIPATGIRGSAGGNDYLTNHNTITLWGLTDQRYRAGLWTASPGNESGHAMALEIHRVYGLSTGTIHHPMAAMNVRCAKDTYRLPINTPQGKDDENTSIKYITDDKNKALEKNSTEIIAYPNPTNGIIHIISDTENTKWQLVNTMGISIIADNLSSSDKEITIDISNLPKGIYFLKVINDNHGVRYQKIIKK